MLMVHTRVVRIFRIDLHPPESVCPSPKRLVSPENANKKVGNHLQIDAKIWFFIDFQAKSQLYSMNYSK